MGVITNGISDVNILLLNENGDPVDPILKSCTLGLKSKISLARLNPTAGISLLYLSDV